jgi:hypothetical protein
MVEEQNLEKTLEELVGDKAALFAMAKLDLALRQYDSELDGLEKLEAFADVVDRFRISEQALRRAIKLTGFTGIEQGEFVEFRTYFGYTRVRADRLNFALKMAYTPKQSRPFAAYVYPICAELPTNITEEAARNRARFNSINNTFGQINPPTS